MAQRPDFVAQSAEPMTPDERKEWFRQCADEFKAKGATWGRFAVDDAEEPTISLVEAWLIEPAQMPPPHFQMVKLDDAI